MAFAIIVSEQDPAGMNIKARLLESYGFKEKGEFEGTAVFVLGDTTLYTIKGPLITAEGIDKQIPEDFLIFGSKHASKEEVHSLSCHCTGNFGEAKYGGQDKKLSMGSALMLKKAYLELLRHKEEVPDHQITLEATHHGPLLEKPHLFIEIGSTEEHWGNEKAGKIIAQTIMHLIEGEDLAEQEIVFAIGGTHYCATFNKILQRTNLAFAHVCAKYGLEHLDEELIQEAFEKTSEKATSVLLDWKGLGKEKERIKSLLETMGIEYKRSDKL
ncbi:hypothetical protein GOV09_03830 [Candidatus Woesearchaeota archaeon]|nr:hypothetical protein [Candidatus Woesearchaeota archaeon]